MELKNGCTVLFVRNTAMREGDMDALDILVAKADKDARKSSVRQTKQDKTIQYSKNRNETKENKKKMQ